MPRIFLLFDSVWNLVLQIEERLSQGCTILVHGWELHLILTFSADDIQIYQPQWPGMSLFKVCKENQSIVFALKYISGCNHVGPGTGKETGNLTKVNSMMSLERFICLADMENTCCNLLDLPNTQPNYPVFIRYVNQLFPCHTCFNGFQMSIW